MLSKLKCRGFRATSLSTYDFSTLYTTLPHNLIKEKLLDLIEWTFKGIGSLYLACNDRKAFFTSSDQSRYTLWSCQNVCEALFYLLDNTCTIYCFTVFLFVSFVHGNRRKIKTTNKTIETKLSQQNIHLIQSNNLVRPPFRPTIRKTCPCNVYPLEPNFYIANLGYGGVCLFFLFLLQNIECGYSLEPPRRGGSNVYPQSMF